jgi:hypothetical protein
LVDRRKLDFVYAAKLDFASREKRASVSAAKLILWVDVRGEEVAFSRRKVDVRGEEVDFRRKAGRRSRSDRRFDLAG